MKATEQLKGQMYIDDLIPTEEPLISKEEAAAQLMTGIIRAVESQAVGSGQEQMALLARYVRRAKR